MDCSECYESFIHIIQCYNLDGIVKSGYMIPSTLYTDREVYLNRIPYRGDSLLYYTQLDTCIEEELLKKPAIVVEK